MVPMRLIDSFLLRDGRLIQPAGHAARLRRASSMIPLADGTLTQALQALPRTGLYFPRIVLSTDAPPAVEPRPWSDTQLMTTATLAVHPEPDQRAHPRLKGPDFSWQHAVRDSAVARGAHDALLEDPARAGEFRESAFGTVVWWNNGVLMRPGNNERLLSTTEAALAALCATKKVQVGAAPMTRETLQHADAVWLLSALHTIRDVTHIDGVPCRATVDSSAWRSALWAQAGTLDDLLEAL